MKVPAESFPDAAHGPCRPARRRRWAVLGMVMGLVFFAAGRASAVESMLVVPRPRVAPHGRVPVTVVIKNPEKTPVRWSITGQTAFDLVTDKGKWRLRAKTVGTDKGEDPTLPAGAYREIPVLLSLPDLPPGYAELRLVSPPSNTVLLRIVAAGGTPSLPERPEKAPPGAQSRLSVMESKIQPYFSNLFFYEPIYFLAGTDPEKSKFQLSFKYSLFRDDSPLAERHPLFKGIHFAYTQTSFWDLKSDSAPFEDTSYKPEIFYVSPNFDLGIPRLYTANLQIGARHESNGRGGTLSRSTNTVYVKPIFMFAGKDEESGIMVAPKFMAYAGNDSHTNPDLPDYRGHFDLEIMTGFLKSFVFGTHLRYGQKGGSAQFDLTHPMPAVLGDNIDLYFYAQYFTGYAESLLHYDRKESALRFGFSIAR